MRILGKVRSNMSRIKVFLDTNVLASYFSGKPGARRLFDPDVTKRVQYIISPIVLQELLLISEELGKNGSADEMKRLLSKYLTIKPLDEDIVQASAKRIRQLRNTILHANDLLNIEVAAITADYFLTQDKNLLGLREIDSVELISPEQFFDLLKEAA
jgi:predicted nucleic acid-binding protein